MNKKDYINSKLYYHRADEEVKLAKHYEKDITKKLKRLCKKYKGKLQGLNYKIKDTDKVMLKIKLKGENYELRDILRYTIVFPTYKYTRGVYDIFIDLMNDESYKTKHRWVKQQWCVGDMYQGINTSWGFKKSFVFELQFHTEESFIAKTTGDLHKIYDQYNHNKCDHIFIGNEDYINGDCRNNRDTMIQLEDEIPVPPELNNDKCGYDIEEWYKILKIPSKLKSSKKKKTKRRLKTKRKPKTKKKKSTKSKKK